MSPEQLAHHRDEIIVPMVVSPLSYFEVQLESVFYAATGLMAAATGISLFVRERQLTHAADDVFGLAV